MHAYTRTCVCVPPWVFVCLCTAKTKQISILKCLILWLSSCPNLSLYCAEHCYLIFILYSQCCLTVNVLCWCFIRYLIKIKRKKTLHEEFYQIVTVTSTNDIQLYIWANCGECEFSGGLCLASHRAESSWMEDENGCLAISFLFWRNQTISNIAKNPGCAPFLHSANAGHSCCFR